MNLVKLDLSVIISSFISTPHAIFISTASSFITKSLTLNLFALYILCCKIYNKKTFIIKNHDHCMIMSQINILLVAVMLYPITYHAWSYTYLNIIPLLKFNIEKLVNLTCYFSNCIIFSITGLFSGSSLIQETIKPYNDFGELALTCPKK